MESEEDKIWTEEEIEEWEHDEWLRMEVVGGPSIREILEEQMEKRRRRQEGEEEEEEMEEDPYENEERLKWKEEERKAREAYFKEIEEEDKKLEAEIREEEKKDEENKKLEAEIREEEKKEEEDGSKLVYEPNLRPVDSSTLRPSDSSTNNNTTSIKSKLDNSQAVVEFPRDEGAQSSSDEGDDDPRAEGAETAKAEDDKPQWCDTGQIRNGCFREEEVKIEGQKEEEKKKKKKRRWKRFSNMRTDQSRGHHGSGGRMLPRG